MTQFSYLQNQTNGPATPPFVVTFPQRKMLSISYGRNNIFVFLNKALPDEYMARAEDITDQSLPIRRDGIPVCSGKHHNRIVASYHPEINQLIILHFKRIYSVKLPPYIKEISCF